jgi:hypothetical protein
VSVERTSSLATDILELGESLTDADRQAVGGFLDEFIGILERTAAEVCRR